MRPHINKFASMAFLLLSIGAVAAAEPEAGKVGQGGAPLLAVPDAMKVEAIVCTLAENTPVILVSEQPLVGPDGKVAVPGFYKQVQVVDGTCAGKTGWLTVEKYSRR